MKLYFSRFYINFTKERTIVSITTLSERSLDYCLNKEVIQKNMYSPKFDYLFNFETLRRRLFYSEGKYPYEISKLYNILFPDNKQSPL